MGQNEGQLASQPFMVVIIQKQSQRVYMGQNEGQLATQPFMVVIIQKHRQRVYMGQNEGQLATQPFHGCDYLEAQTESLSGLE